MALSTASQVKLATCDRRLWLVVNDAAANLDILVICGHRDQAEQEAAFVAGKTQKHWPFGNHNALPSRAADIMPISHQVGDPINWKDLPAFARLMGYIEACADRRGIKLRFGMDWDGDWRSVGFDHDEHFLDAPHVELAASEI